MNEPERLLRPSEVARILGVSIESVRKLCESGKLRCVFPLGTRTRRVQYSVLQKFIAEIPSNQDGNSPTTVEKMSIEQFAPKTLKAKDVQPVPDVFARLGVAKYFEN